MHHLRRVGPLIRGGLAWVLIAGCTGDTPLVYDPFDPSCAALDTVPEMFELRAENNMTRVGEGLEIRDMTLIGPNVVLAGRGGVWVVKADVEDPALVVNRPVVEDVPLGGRAVAALDERYLVASKEIYIMSVLDMVDPGNPVTTWSSIEFGAWGLAAEPGRFYAGQGDKVTIFDARDPTDVVELGVIDGLQAAHALELASPWLYVADLTTGLFAVDVSDPQAPVAYPVSGSPGIQSLKVSGDLLYAASGAAGVEVYSLDEPSAPTLLWSEPLPGAAVDVVIQDDLVHVIDLLTLRTYDAYDGVGMRLRNVHESDQYVTGAVARGEHLFAGEWSILRTYEVDEGALLPIPAVEREVLGDGVSQVHVVNEGTSELLLGEPGLDVPHAVVDMPVHALAPSESTTVEVGLPDVAPFANLCIPTNSPAKPVISAELLREEKLPTNSLIGKIAPNFVLDDLDGIPHQLSAEVGAPVLLSYFATW